MAMTEQEQREYVAFATAKGVPKDQIFAFLDKDAETASAPVPATPSHQEGALSSVLGTAAELGGEYAPSTFIASGVGEALSKLGIENTLGEIAKDYATSLLGGVGDVIAGGRESFNKYVQGDEQELASLNQDSLLRKQRLAELTKNSPVASQIGSTVGKILPAAAVGAVAAPMAGTSLTGMTALGSGMGALEGLTQSYTPQEEASGDRESGIGSSAFLGGAGALAVPAAVGIRNAVKNFNALGLPEDNLRDFVAKTLRAYNEGNPQAGLDKIRSLHKNYLYDKADEFRTLYTANEKNLAQTMPDKGSIVLDRGIFTPEELANKDVMEAIVASDKGANRLLKTINSSKSQTLEGAASHNVVDFSDASQAVRDLRERAAALADVETGGASAKTLTNIANRIDDTIAKNAAARPDTVGVLHANNQAFNDRFSKEVIPYRDKGVDYSGRWGNWNAGGQEAEVFDRDILSNADAWTSARKDLPDEVIPLLKEQYGYDKLLSGDEKVKYLQNQRVRNQVWEDPAEQEYASVLADQFSKDPTALQQMFSAYGKMPSVTLGPLINRTIRGHAPYGSVARKQTEAEKLANALRGGVIGSSVLPYNQEPPPLVITRGR